jgi:2-hydroxy-3-keto-5-methylthiopentenyl-1-phosphate phosphatase
MAELPVVVDWDGTVTQIDGLHLVLLEFGDEEIYEQHEARLGRDLTLHEVIAGEFTSVRAPLEQVAAWMRENAGLRPGFVEFARRRRPRVVSSGLDPRPGGWRVLFRNAEPCPRCGEPCKRADVEDLREFVYVGDGFSDRCVALQASRAFACDGLAEYLSAERVPYDRFEDFYDVERVLDGGAVVPPSRRRGRKT